MNNEAHTRDGRRLGRRHSHTRDSQTQSHVTTVLESKLEGLPLPVFLAAASAALGALDGARAVSGGWRAHEVRLHAGEAGPLGRSLSAAKAEEAGQPALQAFERLARPANILIQSLAQLNEVDAAVQRRL